MKCGLKRLSLTLLLFFCFCVSLSISENANAESYPISSFSLYGQTTYGASNTWSTGLGYAGRTMHSVYQWEVWTSSLSANETGKYGTTSLSGFINIPADFRVTLDQGFTITQCVVGNSQATLSNIQTSWTYNEASGSSGPRIVWAATAQLEFATNNISGQMYCTFQSNNGRYFLAHTTSGTGTVSFGTTNFNATFSNNLSDELLQQQIVQNQQIIDINTQIRDGVGQTTDAINNLHDSVTDSTITGNFSISAIQPFGPIAAITQGILGLPAVILNINPCTEITPELPYVHEEITIPCPSTVLRGMMGGFMDYLDVIASAYVWFITARLIFKKVQDMRDPTNEDEEYLDL